MDSLKNCKRITVKIGSSTLTHSATGRLNIRRIESLVRVLSDIKNSGRQIVLVSSGAVSAGAAKIGFPMGGRSLAEKQALAAIGQTELMRLYERLFASYGYNVGQILMTKDVVDDPHRLVLARNTFTKLFELSCIPIVNENDSVSNEEMQFGDNA
jgi:glutamate 5-kinase